MQQVGSEHGWKQATAHQVNLVKCQFWQDLPFQKFCLYLPDCRVLGARIRDQERKMITMGTEIGHVSHDITPIHKVLPE